MRTVRPELPDTGSSPGLLSRRPWLGALALSLIAALGPQCSGGCRKPTPAGKPNVLIITLDTLRADHVGCYGYEKVETPTIDDLASRGYLFEQAFSSSPVTATSHSTILTGTFPTFHGVRNNGNYALAKRNETLTETLKKQGYNTAAFVSSFVLDSRFGLNQGFDHYSDDLTGGTSQFGPSVDEWVGHSFEAFERDASLTNEDLLPYVSEKLEPPYMLWVHYYDPHFPYTPPPPFDEKYPKRPYDGEIAFMDHQIGKLLASLEERDLLDDTIIVIVADHGEGLGQHEKTHGGTLFDPLLQVPLIIVPTEQAPDPVRIDEQVQTVDIVPTILALLGLEIPGFVHGQSLLPLMFPASGDLGSFEQRPAYAETHRYERPYKGGILRSLRTPKWKLITLERDGKKKLYNLALDPGEKKNLAKKKPVKVQKLEKKLETLVEDHSVDGVEADEELPVDKSVMDKLKALGYVQ